MPIEASRQRRGGRVVMLRSAKPYTAVRFRSPASSKALIFQGFCFFWWYQVPPEGDCRRSGRIRRMQFPKPADVPSGIHAARAEAQPPRAGSGSAPPVSPGMTHTNERRIRRIRYALCRLPGWNMLPESCSVKPTQSTHDNLRHRAWRGDKCNDKRSASPRRTTGRLAGNRGSP